MKRLLLAAVLSFVPALAWAQSTHDFPTTNQGERVPGIVTMCLNGSGQAVPCANGGTAAEVSSVPGSLSGLNLLETEPASARSGWWFFQNQSAVSLTVALDDGAGNALSVFVIAPGAGAGQQGGSMGSADTGPHTGRIRVYGVAGSQHALRVQ